MNYFIFDNIIYNKPHNNNYGREIKQLIGIDSETYIDGTPFLFCTSDGHSFTLKDIPEIFFTRRYIDRHFAVYNLKFDSGSILYGLSIQALNILRQYGEVEIKDVKYSYIPHKRLRITKNNHGVTFWNIAQFFKTSLENASALYLNKHKKEIGTKSFTRKYVTKHLPEIKKYCVQDAVLTAELYDYFLLGLKKLKIVPTALYSTASLSYQYFRQRIKIPDVWNIWCHHKYLLKLACYSYTGGKFEMISRGKFDGYNYDLNSAYPYEMSQLKSLDNARLVCRPVYMAGADYGFMKVCINNSDGMFLPCTIRPNGYNIYPAGVYYCTITKQEYDYLMELKIDVKIYSAFWIFCRSQYKPLYNTVTDLYKMKSEYKNIDKQKYSLCKILLNSYYGKMCQLVKKSDGEMLAGNCWQPIFASIITANIRIKICKMQNEYKKHIYAVHTDSILTDTPLPDKILSDNMGQWQLAGKGKGVVVACGIYQIGDKYALRGFKTTDPRDLMTILYDNDIQEGAILEQLNVKSWTESVFRNKKQLTNVFIYENKILDYNQDIKRNWPNRVNGKWLLHNRQDSLPLLVVQRKNPFN